VQEPFNKALLTGKITQAAWRSKPSFYASPAPAKQPRRRLEFPHKAATLKKFVDRPSLQRCGVT